MKEIFIYEIVIWKFSTPFVLVFDYIIIALLIKVHHENKHDCVGRYFLLSGDSLIDVNSISFPIQRESLSFNWIHFRWFKSTRIPSSEWPQQIGRIDCYGANRLRYDALSFASSQNRKEKLTLILRSFCVWIFSPLHPLFYSSYPKYQRLWFFYCWILDSCRQRMVLHLYQPSAANCRQFITMKRHV